MAYNGYSNRYRPEDYPPYYEYSRGRESRPRERSDGYGRTERIVKEYLEYPDGRKVEITPGSAPSSRGGRAPSPRRLRRTVIDDDYGYSRDARSRRHRSYDGMLDDDRRYVYSDRRPGNATMETVYNSRSTGDRYDYTRRYNEHLNNGRLNLEVTQEGKPLFINKDGVDDKYRIVTRKLRDVSPPPPEVPPRRYLPEEGLIETRSRGERVLTPVRRYGSPERQYRSRYQYPDGY